MAHDATNGATRVEHRIFLRASRGEQGGGTSNTGDIRYVHFTKHIKFAVLLSHQPDALLVDAGEKPDRLPRPSC